MQNKNYIYLKYKIFIRKKYKYNMNNVIGV